MNNRTTDRSARKKGKDANMLIVLGFAFYRINLDLLRPEVSQDVLANVTRVFATALDVSSSDCAVIRSALAQFGIGGGSVALDNMKCSQLFDEYQRTFALE